MTFRDALVQWFQAKQPRRTSSRYTEDVWSLAKRWLEAWPEGPSAKELEAYYLRRREEVSASRLNTEGASLRSFYQWAGKRGYVEDIGYVWESVRRGQQKEPVSLSDDKLRAIVEASDPELKRVIQVAVATGLRAGTLRALTWEMIEDRMDGPVLVLPASVMKARRAEIIPLSAAARAVLGPRGSGSVFEPIHDYALSRRFKEAAQRAGVEGVTFHDLRKTFASRLLSANTPIHVVMKLGAWRSPGVLLKHYAAVESLEQGRRALETAAAR